MLKMLFELRTGSILADGWMKRIDVAMSNSPATSAEAERVRRLEAARDKLGEARLMLTDGSLDTVALDRLLIEAIEDMQCNRP